MLNRGQVADAALNVIDYTNPVVAAAMANGQVNTPDEALLANVQAAVRLGHPQMRPSAPRPEKICLVGSGPSLAATEEELRECYFQGARIVTVNGAYHWCRERNLRPSTQIVMDARASNARFVTPYVPQCRYALASQCAPASWAAVAEYPDVWVWHAAVSPESPVGQFLDGYYQENWFGVGGGVTVASRAIGLLRMVGYQRFELFGIDCCWLDGRHHAFAQPENAGDKWFRLRAGPTTDDREARVFAVSPWHLKQLEDFLLLIRVNGKEFQLAVHGDGLLAYAVRTLALSPDLAFEAQEPVHA